MMGCYTLDLGHQYPDGAAPSLFGYLAAWGSVRDRIRHRWSWS